MPQIPQHQYDNLGPLLDGINYTIGLIFKLIFKKNKEHPPISYVKKIRYQIHIKLK
jgi:hypothetical protein